MHLLEVIPAAKIPLVQSQIYTYYTSLKLPRGSLVLVSINKRLVEGLVIESKELKAEKMSIKRLDYELKSISEILFNGEAFNNNSIGLVKWLAEYYHIPLGLSLKAFLPKHPKKMEYAKKAVAGEELEKIPVLPLNFQDTFNAIDGSLRNTLIHNKADNDLSVLWANLIYNTVKNKKQALIIVPETNLAKNFYLTMRKYFGKNAVLLSKDLSQKKYWEAWQRIKNNETKIIIGTRSAVFAPIDNAGLIILKDEHSASYKNWDQQPRYNAKDMAEKIAESIKAKIIYESATPSLESYNNAATGQSGLVEINDTEINKAISAPAEIIDMREEMKKGNYSVISERLKSGIEKTLGEGGRIILFINRRGLATAVVCRDCGMAIKCPHCDAPMIYHSFAGKKDRLICHYCNSNAPIPLLCPKCRSHRIKYMGTGTQKVADAIGALFPKAKVRRIDSDALKQEEAFFISAEEIKNADVLIGTQMVISENANEKFSLAGVINADTMLHLPDFRAGEKTFQLLYRLGNMAKKMIIQTYNPENSAIRNAANEDYASFFKKEIEDRKALSYPPFSKLIKLSYYHKDPLSAKKEARLMLGKLSNAARKMPEELRGKIEILGPAPAYVYKIKNRYAWNIILKIKNDEEEKIKFFLLKDIPGDWLIDVNPISLL